MNVDRMRRTLERSRALTAERQHARRLANMTPEHRAHHEKMRLPGSFCQQCINEAVHSAFESAAAAARKRPSV